ncbi:TetR/AcrR family transcriptional regulator [Actinoplanes couchii]|uniref:HTH-type transcriptional regulator n=1 Tax=Actinoplanes couchii TaxID=403638 RepID=A0ABQ3XP66_9ACTN|nr:TetR/AcrR family transcriptional regulator [Actinoplanes couchii]MDR6318667.1 AcrR family transcriptional regulator [Actinoplanes couchii]GID60274.1 putative HTH-type transcriptional regulator [Actinoplanes couchii]
MTQDDPTAGHTVPDDDGDGGGTVHRRPGRKPDPRRDAEIMEAALQVLAEVGYTGMTMNAVAARAKAGKGTFYRRWPSKAELVLDAIGHMKRSQVDLDRLPDTGTLRGDILALFKPTSAEDGEYQLTIMAGLASMLSQDRGFAEAANDAIVEPWAAANRVLLSRAMSRGEINATADIETLAQIIPSIAAYRALIQRKPFDRDFLVAIIDGVLLPAVRP